jgi:cell division septation protein DedD
MMTRRMRSAGLGFGQLFVLIFGFLITSALIFLFGIWVGRDVTERRLAQEERVVRLPAPVQPTAKEEEKNQNVDLSFYQSLKEKAYQRLQETAVAQTATPAHVAQVSTPTTQPQRVVETVKPIATPTRLAKAKHPEHPRAGDEWADAGWTVQVNATTNPQQATELARNLRAKGYDAYTVQAPMRGQTWYRVRVGRFGNHDRDQAKELEARLKNDGLDNAYVTPQ